MDMDEEHDGTGSLSMPVRMLAGFLGVFFLIAGLGLAITGLLNHPMLKLAFFEGVLGPWFGYLFLRAAWTGVSPGWPD